MVGLKVGLLWYEIGSSDFLHAFFSNIAYHLEKGNWGNKFPILMKKFYYGTLEIIDIKKGWEELFIIKNGLRSIPPKKVIWDIDDLSKQPPWGNEISDDITDLSNYFITCNGVDLIDLLFEAFNKGLEDNEKILVINL